MLFGPLILIPYLLLLSAFSSGDLQADFLLFLVTLVMAAGYLLNATVVDWIDIAMRRRQSSSLFAYFMAGFLVGLLVPLLISFDPAAFLRRVPEIVASFSMPLALLAGQFRLLNRLQERRYELRNSGGSQSVEHRVQMEELQ